MRHSLIVLLGLFLAACRPQPSPTVVVDPALISLVPPDAIGVMGLRMEHLQKTPLWQKYVATQNPPALDQLKKRTGIDPRKDVWDILLVHNGKEPLMLARGKFSEHGREPRVDVEGAQRFSYKGYMLIGNEQVAMSFLNSSTAVGGPTPLVRRVIDQRDSGSGMPKWILDRARTIPSTNQIWFVGSPAGQFQGRFAANTGNLGNILRFVNSVQIVTGQFDLRSGVKGHMESVSVDEPNARRLKDTVRGVLGFARLNAPSDQPDLLRVLDGFDAQQNDKEVTVKVEIPPDLIDRVIELGRSGIAGGSESGGGHDH